MKFEVYGWHPGLKTVSLSLFLRDRLRIPIDEAKNLKIDLIQGRRVIEIEADHDADKLIEDMQRIGLKFRLAGGDVIAPGACTNEP